MKFVAVMADGQGSHKCSWNLLFVFYCFSGDKRRTERAGLLYQTSKKGVTLLLGSITLIPPMVFMKPSSYLKVTAIMPLIITLAHPENRRGSFYY